MKREIIMLAIVAMAISILSGCSSAPTKILMKNCDSVGDNLYRCEEIPKKEFGGRNR